MAISGDSLQEELLKAWLTYQKRLEQRIEWIHWRHEKLIPEVEKLKAGRGVMGLKPGEMFDLVVEKPRALRPARQAKKRT